jgi:hypothetical protein
VRALRGRAARDLAVLAALACALVGVSAAIAGIDAAPRQPRAFAAGLAVALALHAAAAVWVLRRRPPAGPALALILVAGLAAGLAQVPHRPDTSGDVHRYVWDGRVLTSGINPYRYPPEHPALVPLRDEAVYPGINRKPVRTIYPPAAQGLFAGVYLLHRDSVRWTKLAFVGLAAAAGLALALLLRRLGRRPALTIMFAWHPLVVLEVGRAGHVDVAAALLALLALLAATARRPAGAGALLAAGALVKPGAAIVLPALLGRRSGPPWRAAAAFAATAVALYLPFLGAGAGVLGYLPGYLREEGFASGDRFYPLGLLRRALGRDGLPEAAVAGYQALAALAVAAALAWWWRRPPASLRQAAGRAGGLLLLVLLLATPTYPWYLILLCALLPLMPPVLLAPAAALTATGGFLYLQWWLPGTPGWPVDLAWGLPSLVLAGALARRRGRADPLSRPGPGGAARPAPRRPAPRPSGG